MQTLQSRKTKGFTLIELMIVVAVIGVLAAIAVPQYQNYVQKGALGSALATATALKTNYEDYIAVNGSEPANSSAINAAPFHIGNINVASSAITVNVTEGGGSGSSVILTRASNGNWSCTVSSASSVSINGCS